MQKKTFAAYKFVFEYLFTLIPAEKITSFMADYEPAVRKCMKELAPAAIINGCWFHFSKAVHIKAKLLNLVQIGKANPSVQKAIRMAMNLPLLPADKVMCSTIYN